MLGAAPVGNNANLNQPGWSLEFLKRSRPLVYRSPCWGSNNLTEVQVHDAYRSLHERLDNQMMQLGMFERRVVLATQFGLVCL